jgi:predicted MFS family arabinose efflux permease
VLSVAALVALVYGVIEAPDEGWTSPMILGCFAAAAVLAAAFIKWELHTKEPMLNLTFFRNPRFSVAATAISLAFFSLFGAIFALTQYLQDAHGYSALRAGAAMVPLAFGLVAGSVSSIKLVARFGTTRVVLAGLLGLGGLLATSLVWTADMAYWPLGLWFFATALSMGWIMGPATDAVMGAVPEEKAGVASAMNDVTRQVGGSLGTAIIGSLISSLYASRLGDAVAGLPREARTAAEDSIGRANSVAEKLPVAEGARLTIAAADAFTQAMGIGFTVAAGAALVAAIAVKLWLPAKHGKPAKVVELPLAGEIQEQAA